MNCRVWDNNAWMGGWLLLWAHRIHNIYGLRRAWYEHGLVVHVHWNNQFGSVMSWGLDV